MLGPRPVPATPAERNQPARPAAPAERNQPARPATPAERNQPARPATPAERNQPARPAAPAERNQPARPAAPAERNQPARPAAPAERNQPARPAAPAERNQPATLIVDFGTATAAGIVVTEQGAWLVEDPVSGGSRWPCALHWDGQRISAGAAAHQRGQADPAGYATDLKRALATDDPVPLGMRRLRPVELVAEFFAVLRRSAQRLVAATNRGGVLDRAVVTIPASVGATDPLRSQLVGAAEAAGFTAVELLVEPAGAVWAPGSPLRVGHLALVYDLGATFEAVLVRVGDDLPEVIGFASIMDLPADPALVTELTIACCHDLLNRLGVRSTQVDWVLPVGGGANAPGLAAALEQSLGIAVAQVTEPELAVLRGAAVWLPRSGPRSVHSRSSGQRMVPLVFTIPGGSARLLRWLVEPQQPYDEGAPVARVRLSGGAVWDLVARTRGTMDEVLVPGGHDVRSGDWLALVRPR